MNNSEPKKKVSIATPVMWLIVTLIWTSNLCMNISGGARREIIMLQCVTVILSFAAAISNYIRYRRSKNDAS
jgi:hypothetical protein